MSDVRDYDLDDELAVDGSQQLKALGDPLRSRITTLVLERAMSVSELAERLGRPKGTIGYHVDVLVDAGLLKVVRTRRVRAIEERFYGRVARTYMFPHPVGDVPFLQDFVDSFDQDAWDADDVPDRIGIATLRSARIPPERAAEYVDRLHRLTLEFVDEPRDGDIEYGLYVALYTQQSDEEVT